MATDPKFEVRKFRRFTGARGMIGFVADLYVDGRLAGSMENEGNGGGTWLRPSGDREAAGALEAHVLRLVEARKVPDHAGEAVMPALATEAFLNDLSFKAEEEAAFRRICKTKIVLKLPAHGYGECLEIGRALDDDVRRQIAERWPDAEIVNDRLGIAPQPKPKAAKKPARRK